MTILAIWIGSRHHFHLSLFQFAGYLNCQEYLPKKGLKCLLLCSGLLFQVVQFYPHPIFLKNQIKVCSTKNNLKNLYISLSLAEFGLELAMPVT